jgi:copper chaperone NosL
MNRMNRMNRISRALVVAAALAVAAMLVTPLWTVHLVAPQYPEGLGMTIHINTVRGTSEFDLMKINQLNHYIGMKRIEPDAIPELRIMPWIVGALALSGLGVAAAGRRRLLVAWLAAFMVCAAVGLADFWRWEYDYGHDLDFENAIIKVPGMTYQPPLIGSKQLLNFTATSWPATGAIAGGIAMALGVAALAASGRGRSRPDDKTLGNTSVVAAGPAAHGVART